MRSFTVLCCVAVLAGCTKAEDRSVGAGTTIDTMAAPAGEMADASISLGDLAGTWKIRSTDSGGANRWRPSCAPRPTRRGGR